MGAIEPRIDPSATGEMGKKTELTDQDILQEGAEGAEMIQHLRFLCCLL